MKKLFILFILLIIFPITVNAYDINCDKGKFKYGSEVNCKLVGDETNISYISGTITYINGLKCELVSKNDNMNSNIFTDSNFYLTGTNKGGVLANIKCLVTNMSDDDITSQIIIENLIVKEENKDEESLIVRSNQFTVRKYEEEKDNKPRDTSVSDTLLKSVTIDNIDFVFSRFITVYDLYVDKSISSVNFNIEKNNYYAYVDYKNTVELNMGDNIIDIYVTSPNWEHKICYTFNIRRMEDGEVPYNKDTDATLKKLVVDGANIVFDKNTYEYTIDLDTYKINDIITETSVEDATVKIVRPNSLKNNSRIIIEVISRDKSVTNNYVLKIIKKEEDQYLKYYIILIVLLVLIIIIVIIIIITNSKKKKNTSDYIIPEEKNKDDASLLNNTVKIPIQEISNVLPNTPDKAVLPRDKDLNNTIKIDVKEFIDLDE